MLEKSLQRDKNLSQIVSLNDFSQNFFYNLLSLIVLMMMAMSKEVFNYFQRRLTLSGRAKLKIRLAHDV